MTLKPLLDERRAVLVPGAPNALAARIIEALGFEALYVTGAGVTNMALGLPDLAFIDLTQVAQVTAAIREVTALPLIVDADTGFGNAINVGHTVRVLERAGADAIQIEDQVSPKRCGHFAGKAVVPAAEMAAKVRAAVDARRSADTLIVARTDARAVEGCTAYIDGIADASAFYQRLRPADGSKGGALPGYICVPGPTTGVQLRQAVVDWYKKHAGEGQKQASGIVLRALDETFLCLGEQRRIPAQP